MNPLRIGKHSSSQKKNKEEPFPVAKEVGNKILSALEVLEKGNADRGVELLLEAILLFGPKAG
jgi:hypothetical protein